MTAVSGGCFALQPIPDPALGPRKVDVATMYNTERYRPTYDRKLGLPIFLTRESAGTFTTRPRRHPSPDP